MENLKTVLGQAGDFNQYAVELLKTVMGFGKLGLLKNSRYTEQTYNKYTRVEITPNEGFLDKYDLTPNSSKQVVSKITFSFNKDEGFNKIPSSLYYEYGKRSKKDKFVYGGSTEYCSDLGKKIGMIDLLTNLVIDSAAMMTPYADERLTDNLKYLQDNIAKYKDLV
jgi:hypothetical protein